ncbi:cell envelope integrity protein TolA [Sulfitobacter sp.]|uniref:cell envelope integrity protein TolA n=1 Tax=Sulfitobacter sp. TaxID=1903071 RepID=UPI00300233C7
MIASSPTAKLFSFLLATGILVGGMKMASPNMVIEIEGAGATAEAKMGTSFEDMAVGTLTPKPVEDTTVTQKHVDVTEPPKSMIKTPTSPTQKAQQTKPAETAAAPPPIKAQAAPPPTPLLTEQPNVVVAPSSHAAVSTPPVKPAALAPTNPTQTVASQTPNTIAPSQSMRPKRRDPDQAAKVAASRPKPSVTKATPTQKQTKSPRGNAKRNNTRGANNGTSQKADAISQGATKQTSAKSGNAAASNYPGQVMRRISRVRKPRVNSRGTVTIAFSISSGGSLSRVSVARSSGSAALDKAALRVVQKAAPFPKPPSGAKRQFSIRIKGR